MTRRYWTEERLARPAAGGSPYLLIELIQGRAPVGRVVWFAPGGPYHPRSPRGSFEPFASLALAKRAVEDHAIKSRGTR